MSLFDDAFAVGSAARYTLYGEQVTLTPRSRPSNDVNARPSADIARQPVTCTGIWDETPTNTYPDSQQYPGKNAHQVSAGTVVLSVLKSSLPWEPLQDDIAVRLKTGERMIVADPAFDGITDWDLTLTAQKG